MAHLIMELVRRHGVELKRVSTASGGRGPEWAGPCPSCGGTDRFRVWPDQGEDGTYWCRQCGIGGDAIQLLRDVEGLSFREACRRLDKPLPDRASLRTPRAPSPAPSSPRTPEDPDLAWQEKARKFVAWAYEQLLEDDAGLDYLRSRGLRPETAGAFGLGLNPGDRKGKDLYRARESWGLSPVFREDGRRRPLWLPQGLVIPWLDSADGSVLRVRIRRSGDLSFGPRYYVVPGSSSGTLMLGPGSPAHVVVESELDAFLVHQEAGQLVGAVAVGSSNTRPDARALEVLKESRHVLVALDFDKAGAKGWLWWSQNVPEAARWPVPKGKDPGEAWEAGVDLRAWILAGLPEGLRIRMGVNDG